MYRQRAGKNNLIQVRECVPDGRVHNLSVSDSEKIKRVLREPNFKWSGCNSVKSG